MVTGNGLRVLSRTKLKTSLRVMFAIDTERLNFFVHEHGAAFLN
jgi:hypothetical protein